LEKPGILEKQRVRNGRPQGGMQTKDNRPLGQGSLQRKAQNVVVHTARNVNISWYLPAITGELPEIPGVLRTTAGEKGLTVGPGECHNGCKLHPVGEHVSRKKRVRTRRKVRRVRDWMGVPRERIARSDERTSGVSVSWREPGYPVPLHHRGRNTCIQTGQSLETKEDDPG